jgi:CBS-domain-containing membrane protein
MRRDWLQAAADAIRRNDHRNTLAGAVAGLGSAIAIGGMEWFARVSDYPLVIIPFATSMVLVIGSSDAEPSQPRALIGGHVVAILIGLPIVAVDRAAGMGGGRRGRNGRSGDVCHRHVSLAGGDQSPAGDFL